MIQIDRREGGIPAEPNKADVISSYLDAMPGLLRHATRMIVPDPVVTIRVGVEAYVPGGSFKILDQPKFRDGYTAQSFVLPDGSYTIFEDSSREWYDIEARTCQVFRALDGNDVEVDSYTPGRPDTELMGKDYWTSWKDGTRSGHAYTRYIYPEVVNQLLPGLISAKGAYRHADLFGGDGEFTNLLLYSAKMSGASASFDSHVVDLDPVSLAKAHGRSGSQVEAAKGVVHDLGFTVEDPVNLTDRRKRRKLFSRLGEQDLVTVLGGLNYGVIELRDAYSIAKDIREMLLAPGGKCVVTGLSPSLLNSSVFTELGFAVLQMSVPGNIWMNRIPRQLYVLQNPQGVSEGE